MTIRKRKAIAAALVALVGSGVYAGTAIGDNDEPVQIAADNGGPAVAVDASVARMASMIDFLPFAVRVDHAREVPAPATARTAAPWYVVPADRGACASLGDGGLVCGTDEQLTAGRIIAVDRPLPKMQSDGTLEAAVKPLGPLRIAGLVADDVVEVVAYDDSGAVIGRTRVEGNVYEIPLNRPRSFNRLVLLGTAGSATATLDIGD